MTAGGPYAMVYHNVHADPTHNFSSANSPTVKESEAGPNGRNNLDPNAPGAIAGLDPREAVAVVDQRRLVLGAGAARSVPTTATRAGMWARACPTMGGRASAAAKPAVQSALFDLI